MPEYPIYVTLLPESARETIGKVHLHTEPAQAILVKEGFTITNEVDIFDAGPILSAERQKLRSWTESSSGTILEGTPDSVVSKQYLLTNQSLSFRAVIAEAHVSESDEVMVSSLVSTALDLLPGESVMYLPLDTK